MSGFQHAPVSLGLMVVPPVASLFAALLSLKPWVPLVLSPHLTKHLQLYRLVASAVVALDSATLLFYLLLVYHTGRHAERVHGSRKFVSYLALVLGVERLLSLLVLAGLHGTAGRNTLAAGPWALAAAVVGKWWSCTPRMYTFEVFGVELGDKIYPFVLCAVMACSAPLPCLIAALSTYLILSHPLLGSYLLPAPLASAAQRFLLPLLPDAHPPKRSTDAWPEREPQDDPRRRAVVEGLRRRVGAAATTTTPGGAGTAAATTAAAPTPASILPTATPPPTRVGPPPQEPSAMSQWVSVLSASVTGPAASGPGRAPAEEDIAALSAMFPAAGRARVVRALTESDFERERAVESLLAGS